MFFLIDLALLLALAGARRFETIRLKILPTIFIAFAGFMTLSTIWSGQTWRGLTGSIDRMDGALLWLHAALFLIALILLFVNDRERLLGATTIAATLVAIIGLAQFLPKIGAALNASFFAPGDRLSSTIGNPVLVAGYLLPHLFFAALLGRQTTGRKRIFWIICALLLLAALYFSGTRGAWAGLIVTAVYLLTVNWLNIRRPIRIALLGFIFLALSVLAWNILNTNKAEHLLQQTTVSTRLINTTIALNALTAKPILGWGHGSYETVFDKLYDQRLLAFSVAETVFDKTHNQFLEFLVTGGLIGFVLFLLLFVKSVTALTKPPRHLDKQIFSAAILAYGIFLLFGFETTAGIIPFVLILGVSDELAGTWRTFTLKPRSALAIKTLALILLFGLTVLTAVVGARTLQALLALRPGIHKIAIDSTGQEKINRALAVRTPYRDDLVWKIAIFWLGKARQLDRGTSGQLDNRTGAMGKQILDELMLIPNKNRRLYSVTGQVAQMLAALTPEETETERLLKIAGDNFHSAWLVNPNRQYAAYALAVVMAQQKRFPEALNTILQVDPKLMYPDTHWFAGIVLKMAGEDKQAEKAFTAAREAGFMPPPGAVAP
ncbi:MAG: TPR protein [Candidatus Magasanikbacteria bacterium]|nr:TPR protein [Candidatus Magasanikbacteria bacterium]